jgi:hypothetical protein
MMKTLPQIMTTKFRRVGGASCRIGTCAAIPEVMRKRSREITDLRTDPGKRRRGFATTLLHSLCREADEAQILLILRPEVFREPDDEFSIMSQDDLEAWYICSFGFQLIQTEPVRLMARPPGSTPKVRLRLNNITRATIESIK